MGTSASVPQSDPASEKGLKRHTCVQQTQDTDTTALFGASLQHLREEGRLQHGVPLVLKSMVDFLEKYGLQQTGVFRVCGSAKCCKTLRECLDRGESVDLERADVPTVATLLKLYLREIPGGLIPHIHSMCMQQALKDAKEGTELVESLKEILHRLPDDNYNLLSYLLYFLSQVATHSQWNHMTSENLAKVFGPCIFRVPESPRMLEEQTMCNTLTLHLLEKHTQLIPNTHDSCTGCTHVCNNNHTHTTQSTESMLSPTHLQQEQSCTSEKECDHSVGVANETSALTPTSADPLSYRFSNIDMTDMDVREGNSIQFNSFLFV
ncbi:protein FAM13A-like isoform X2 [Silurus meridionalis]|uniref:Rho-GAP domain-containing protein n=1 Tax=Silurus meridionalis TaxID=175797 RepID=A0A8T0BCB7_SILME|nr:protein FAM13A-like isoform X2 [Silurus meridionalis]KAF7704714.1 hypothetical protein HF521_021786 [Silurus meridionalis]